MKQTIQEMYSLVFILYFDFFIDSDSIFWGRQALLLNMQEVTQGNRM